MHSVQPGSSAIARHGTTMAPAAAAASPPTVELAEGAGVQVPNLAGKTVREVTEICEQLGVNPVLVGNGIVQEQEPEAGATVRRGGIGDGAFRPSPELTAVRAESEPKLGRDDAVNRPGRRKARRDGSPAQGQVARMAAAVEFFEKRPVKN